MQIGHSLRYLSQFFVGFAIGFISVWQLTLLTLAVVPLIAIAGGAYTLIMSTISQKGEAAYAEAGKIAEEVSYSLKAFPALCSTVTSKQNAASSIQHATVLHIWV